MIGAQMLVVRKVLNNSVVLCTDDQGRDCVATGRGIAFLVPVGGTVDPALVQRLFVAADPDSADRLAARIATLPAEVVALATAIGDTAGQEFGDQLAERLVVPLADHLDGALERARAGVTIDYPLRWETEAFYPGQVRFARSALGLIERETGVLLPEVEAIPIALHLVNAELGTTSVGATLDLTRVVAESLALIEDRLGTGVPAGHPAVARFAAHMHHLVGRHRATGPDPTLTAFLRPLADRRPEVARCAHRIAVLLRDRLGEELDEQDELLLVLHITRLIADSGGPTNPGGHPATEVDNPANGH
ncbi:transcription antiterminator BglG [Cellulomonas denverensis]|nr:transcription antiterminator BglG [Cellulomonas denverensis]